MYFSASRSFVARILERVVSHIEASGIATHQSLHATTWAILADQPQLAMNRQSLDHLIQILRTTLLSLPQDPDFSVEVFDLLVFLLAIGLKVCVVYIEDFNGNGFQCRILAPA